MRVLLHGNVNNLPLQIGMALRTNGVDAHLIFTDAAPLHHPRSLRRRWRWLRPKWIHDHSYLTEADFIRRSPALTQSLSQLPDQFDFALLNGMSPSLAAELGLPQGFVNTGSDLTFYGDLRLPEWRSAGWADAYKGGPVGQAELASTRAFVERQRSGIAHSRFSLTSPRGAHPAADTLFDALGFEDSRRVMWRVADTRGISATRLPSRKPLVITSFARVDFQHRSGGTELDLKGTDVLLGGVAAAVRQGVDVRLELPLKGCDVEAAKNMTRELGLLDRVKWFPETPRHSYLERIAASTLVVDSLGPSGPGTVTHDALASGRPVLGNLEPAVWTTVFGEGYPGLHARTADEVANALVNASHDASVLQELAIEGREFANRHLSLDSNSIRLRSLIEAEVGR